MGAATVLHRLDAVADARGAQAANVARVLVNEAIPNLDDTVSFVKFFGNPRNFDVLSANRAFVKDTFEQVAGALQAPIEFELDLRTSNIAYVLLGAPIKVFLGRSFFSYPVVGGDLSQAGALVHELVHEVRGVPDQVNDVCEFRGDDRRCCGLRNALALAATNPSQAIRNPDNYRVFAEAAWIH